jgi:hypothetical protein
MNATYDRIQIKLTTDQQALRAKRRGTSDVEAWVDPQPRFRMHGTEEWGYQLKVWAANRNRDRKAIGQPEKRTGPRHVQSLDGHYGWLLRWWPRGGGNKAPLGKIQAYRMARRRMVHGPVPMPGPTGFLP